MAPTCINLKERFGDRFKVEYEESYYAERSRRTVEDPWLMILLCRNGHIYPHGGDRWRCQPIRDTPNWPV